MLADHALRRGIRKYRRLRALTQEQLADQLSRLGWPSSRGDAVLSGSVVAKIENGSRDISVGEMFRLAAALQVAPAVLMTTGVPDDEALDIDNRAKGRSPRLLRDWICGELPLTDDHDLTEDQYIGISETGRPTWKTDMRGIRINRATHALIVDSHRDTAAAGQHAARLRQLVEDLIEDCLGDDLGGT